MRYSFLILILVLNVSIASAEKYGPYNQNHTYNSNSDSTERDYNFDFNAADAFNFLGNLINQFGSSNNYAPSYSPGQHYGTHYNNQVHYMVYYTIYDSGRKTFAGSVNVEMNGNHNEQHIWKETYRLLGFDEFGVSYHDINKYCQINHMFRRN